MSKTHVAPLAITAAWQKVILAMRWGHYVCKDMATQCDKPFLKGVEMWGSAALISPGADPPVCLQVPVRPHRGRRMVVLYLDYHLIIHGQPGCLPYSGENGVPHRER